jgi:hypothetical protein
MPPPLACKPKWNAKSEVNAFQDCPVCGYSVEVPGFDCFVCETVYNIPDDMLANFSPAEFAKAMGRAIIVAEGFAA